MVERKKKLYRLPKQGKIFGVCAGLAEYFDMDVTLMRVIFVVLAFAGGAAIPIYVILAIIMPANYGDKEKTDSISENVESLGKDLRDKRIVSRSRSYVGIGLIIVGLWLLLGQFIPELFNIRWDFVWPVILILIGLLIIARRTYER